ncbi:MAG: hypothetical protein Q7T03_10220 [Deltaproteobacteria bacterium]|nr:hypothetical protein [Deltaproteobacteria bacterium]
MSHYYDDTQKQMQKSAEVINKMAQQQQQMMQKLMNTPQMKKMSQKMMKEGEKYHNNMLDEWDVVVRMNLRYYLERHDSVQSDGKTTRTDSHVLLEAQRDFNGKLIKAYTLNKKHPEKYEYEINGLTSEKADVKKVAYDLAMRTSPNGGQSHCHGEAWSQDPGSISAKPLATTESADKRYHIHLDAGITMESQDCFAYPVPYFKADLLLSKDDLDALIKKGYWEKTFDQKYLADVNAVIGGAGWPGAPLYSLVLLDPQKSGNYRDTQVHIEILLSPRIKGPHFAAFPKQTLHLLDNYVTLKAESVPGWQVSDIKPKEGWAVASKYVRKVPGASSSGSTLQLAPLAPGKIHFEVDWTSPTGKKGKSDPFEFTVVQLEFKKEGNCNGFDDVESDPVPTASICVGKDKNVLLEALPRGVQVETRLEAADRNAFQITPQTVPGFSAEPQKITLQGISPKQDSTLTAKIKIGDDDEEYQVAAQIITDTLKMRDIKVLPFFLDSDPLSLVPPRINDMFNQAKTDLKQACVTLDVLPTETLKPKEVPSYLGGASIRYDLENWKPLVDYSRKLANHKDQELTVFIVPLIVTQKVDAKGNMTQDINPLGFQNADYVFVSEASFPQHIHVLGHEIGHYIFKDMYVSLEGSTHTDFSDMLMYHTSSKKCEIHHEEWRNISR